MVNKSGSKSPLSLTEIALAFRRAGWISFWAQLVLGVVASVILGFANFSRGTATSGQQLGTGVGIFFAGCGVIVLGVSVYWAFRYTRIARKLESSNPNNRPRKAETVQIVRLGVLISLVGLLISVVGAQAIVGALVAKSLTLPQAGTGALVQLNPSQIIRPLDIFVVQANTNTVAAHFAGLIGSLWILNSVNQ